MGELSIVQVVMVLVIALLVFGPDRMPEMGRQLGRGLRELRKHATSVTDDLTRTADAVSDPAPTPRAAPTPPQPAASTDTDLLDGVVVAGGEAADQPVAVAPVADSADDLLDGVVVRGDTPPSLPIG